MGQLFLLRCNGVHEALYNVSYLFSKLFLNYVIYELIISYTKLMQMREESLKYFSTKMVFSFAFGKPGNYLSSFVN